ncbi:MAG: hypothetical protein ACK5QX_05405, partial [bacterium]
LKIPSCSAGCGFEARSGYRVTTGVPRLRPSTSGGTSGDGCPRKGWSTTFTATSWALTRP